MNVSRRTLLSAAASPLLLRGATARPNILWLSCEDTGTEIGCYGAPDSLTPTIDKLATQGVRYQHAYTVAGVCAPSRSGIITGMYPSTLGSGFMRCRIQLPPEVKAFPQYLREAGYYCTNNAKTDYNFEVPKGAWDEVSNRAHWRNRGKDQPFFAVFNIETTHESRVRLRGPEYEAHVKRLTPLQRRDPAAVKLPPIYPDTPEARRDWANYNELITAMDYQVGDRLADLEKDGLLENTIVFFWGDHGVGLPRSKRWLYESSTHVPLVIRIPQQFRANGQGTPGSVDRQLISFIDLAPTVLNLAGVESPKHMQGRAFLGPRLSAPREYIFGARDRMDERMDIVRAVRDRRYRYLRNYEPHKPYAQAINYMDQGPTMRDLRKLKKSGELPEGAKLFMSDTKPVEELYDVEHDPFELRNLAASPEHQQILRKLRSVHEKWMLDTRDSGLTPEPILADWEKEFGSRYAAVRRPGSLEYLAQLQRLVDAVNRGSNDALVKKAASSNDPAFRYWAMVRFGLSQNDARANAAALRKALEDSSPVVRIAGARAVAMHLDDAGKAVGILAAELSNANNWVRLHAASALDELGPKAAPAREALAKAKDANSFNYVDRVSKHALEELAR